MTLGNNSNIIDFDEVYGFGATNALSLHLTNQELWIGDWNKGLAGTNETDWAADTWASKTGSVAESWDFSQLPQGIMVFSIRKGIHYALNPNSEASRLVSGRELTADDVVFSMKQVSTNPRAYVYLNVPALRTAQITAPDKWTVNIKIDPVSADEVVPRVTDFVRIVPPEVVQKYGDMSKWQNSVGSGPFMLTDVVDSSSVTLVKNPKFWVTDPLGPGKGNQLPYVDGVKIFILVDPSTRDAAFRTAKVDRYNLLDWETGPALIRGLPEVEHYKLPAQGSGGPSTVWRVDKAPFNDIRVRRALMMAMDWDTVVKSLYGGDAVVLTWPLGRYKDLKNAYLGLDDPEMPAQVKELYSYNPDKAKALLAEAGYPNGFKTSVTCSSSTIGNPNQMDYYSVMKEMFAKVGVELRIDAKESAVMTSIQRSRAFEQMGQGAVAPASNYLRCLEFWGEGQPNGSHVNDPYVDEVRSQMQALAITNRAEADRVHKELMKYVLNQAWAMPVPGTPTYALWWPWLKNYHGEASLGYFNDPIFTQYTWIDQDLKEEMTGRR